MPSTTGFTQAETEPPPGVDVEEDAAQGMALQPGDVITLHMMSGEESQLQGLTVDARGVVHVPLGGDVEVANLPLTDAEARIEAALRPFDRTVRITIIMAQANGHRATVIGAVAEPGRYDIVPGMRLADLLAAAGGSTTAEEGGVAFPTADLHLARLMRDGRPLPVSVALAITGDPRHNVRVRAGDHLYVPPALGQLITVVGEVHSGRVMAYRPGLRLTTALGLAGGPTRDADHGEVIIVRGDHANPTIFQARFDELLEGASPDPILAPGDVVYVAPSGLSRFRDVMSAISPLVSVAASAAIGVAVVQTAR